MYILIYIYIYIYMLTVAYYPPCDDAAAWAAQTISYWKVKYLCLLKVQNISWAAQLQIATANRAIAIAIAISLYIHIDIYIY